MAGAGRARDRLLPDGRGADQSRARQQAVPIRWGTPKRGLSGEPRCATLPKMLAHDALYPMQPAWYGHEIGMSGGDDPDNRRDFPGGWKEDAASAFETSGRSKAQEDLFQSIRELTHLRAATPALRRDALTGLLLEDDAYAFARVTDGSRVVVVFNGAGASAQLHIPLDASGIPNGTRMENLLGTTPAVEARQGALEIQLPPHSAAIYR